MIIATIQLITTIKRARNIMEELLEKIKYRDTGENILNIYKNEAMFFNRIVEAANSLQVLWADSYDPCTFANMHLSVTYHLAHKQGIGSASCKGSGMYIRSNDRDVA